MIYSPLRSVLFVPCGNARAVEKAADLGCDALIYDLEDAVGPAEREVALKRLAVALKGPVAAKKRLVRVHPPSLNTIHAVLKDAVLDGLVVPKAANAAGLMAVRHLWPGLPLWAMIETAQGVVNLGEIAASGVAGLIAGPNDLRKDLRSRPLPDRQDLLFALSQIVLHGRANGRVVLDGVYNQFRDEAGFAAECAHGRALGFDGKTLIHPSQIAPCNAAFSPSPECIAWAEAVVAAFDGSDAGVLPVNGEMVERLHLEEARRILAAAGRN